MMLLKFDIPRDIAIASLIYLYFQILSSLPIRGFQKFVGPSLQPQ